MHGLSLEENLHKIKRKIAEAELKSGRAEGSVTLLAVSKGQPESKIRELNSLGVGRFGENYLQEAQAKQSALKNLGLQWDFIGNLQSKKIKQIVGEFGLIHSVDRLKLAEIISQKAQEKGVRQKILIEVNLGGESTKGGISDKQVLSLVQKSLSLPSLELCGLMVMPPPSEDPEALRPFFIQARNLLEDLQRQVFGNDFQTHPFKDLSMGTSQDFHVAIEEGASLVRLGTLLFGPRIPKGDEREVL